jgi:hypothetical protein
MAHIAATRTQIAELLTLLSVKLETPTVEEMPALVDDAKDAARSVLRSCLAADLIEHIPREEVAALRTELAELGEALQAQIAGNRTALGTTDRRRLRRLICSGERAPSIHVALAVSPASSGLRR